MIDTKALKQKILDLAIRGKLVPQGPSDEPASVLLERIRAEKQKNSKAKGHLESIIFLGDDNRHYEKIDGKIMDIEADIPFEVPQKWAWCRLIDVCNYIQRGKSPKYSTIKKYPVIAQKCNQWNGFHIEKAQFIDPNTVSEYNSDRLLQDGDLLWNSTGLGTLGRIVIYETKLNPYNFAVADSHVTVIRVNKKYALSSYLYLFFSSETVQSVIEKQSDGSTKQKELATTTVKNYLIPLPPTKEQERIVKKVELLFSLINKIESQQTDLQTLTNNIQKRVLDLAIRGKLVPQDPNDELASVLLDRIRTEKETLIKQGKIKRDKSESSIYKGADNCYYEKLGEKIKNIDDEIPFDIPDSWTWVRMGNIGDWGAGATPLRTNSKYFGGNILWLKTGELNNGYVYNTAEKITDLAIKECSLRLNKIGDVLIAMYGATIGKLAIVGKELTTNQACCACTPYNGVYNRYLFYHLLASKDRLIYLGDGGAQSNISKEKLISFFIPLPPLAEQYQVVSAIESTFGTLNLLK